MPIRANRSNTCTVLLGLVNNIEAILKGEATNEAAELLARYRELLLDILESSWSNKIQEESYALDDVRQRLDRLEARLADDLDDDIDEPDEDGGDSGDPAYAGHTADGHTVGSGPEHPRHGQRVKRGASGVIPW